MTALPVAFYLKELSGEASRRRGAGMIGPEEASDLDFRLKEAHARGVAEGRATALAEQAAASAEQDQAFAQRLAAERQTWAAEEGERLGSLIEAGFRDLEMRVSDLVGEVLQPVVAEQIRAKAVDGLAHALAGLLSKGDYAKIAIAGPSDLLASMKTRLAADHPGLSFEAAAGPDVTITADETILATQIGAWVDAISGSEP